MKILRHIGSLAFVLGLFTAVFIGLPWYVMVADDPALPWWLKATVFCLLGGILLVLVTVALEQRKSKPSETAPLSDESDRTVLLLNSESLRLGLLLPKE
jgi:membrane protein implicated in regulation of membrane protease activity